MNYMDGLMKLKRQLSFPFLILKANDCFSVFNNYSQPLKERIQGW